MKRHLPVFILVLVNLIIGAATFRSYGESWDVNSLRHYADGSISYYGKIIGSDSFLPSAVEEDLPLGAYGPAFVILARLIERAASHDAQHIVYFVAFQIGVLAFYFLCLRWMKPNAAFGAALLFSTQPVLWGHAFINPKDIPFLTFFILTLLCGLRMADNFEPIPFKKPLPLALVGLPFVIIFFGSGFFLATLESLIRSASAGATNVISWVASDIGKVPPEVYIVKYSSLYIRACFVCAVIVLLILSRRLPPLPLGEGRGKGALPIAALILGISVSIRNLGIYAGLIVAGYILWKHGRKSFALLSLYGIIAAITMYLTWPYLWLDPVGHLSESLVTMSRYPWTGSILFNGIRYSAGKLPFSYLPLLLGIQLTEPVWVLFMIGLLLPSPPLHSGEGPGVRAYSPLHSGEGLGVRALTALWFAIPLIGLIAARVLLYDNFRQILFILPPVFIMTGIAFDKIQRPALQFAVILLCALSGIMGIARLHPYEYAYYNAFAGDPFRRFELDYWGTSYREAAEWLNANAPEDANIWAEGQANLLSFYLRKDLNLYSWNEVERADHYDYIVATTREDFDLTAYPDAPIVYKITRGDSVLTVIKKP